ncbi:MAG: hypothetical protein ABIO70_33275 [Pseudomonadota bacterium]
MRSAHAFQLTLTALGITVLSGYSSCGEDILADPGFDLWCGDQLCTWEVEEGEVEKVPTWDERDEGASLVGPAVAISQPAAVSGLGARCIYFTLLADADEGATLRLQLDFLDDGSVEYDQEIPAEDWENIGFHITTPDWYDGLRFRIRKDGDERAVIAQVRAQSVPYDDCTAAPLELNDRPDGAECAEGEQCASGTCGDLDVLGDWLTESCGACQDDRDCGEGEACGEEFGAQQLPYLACGEPGRHSLGEACQGDAECATGICIQGQCAECGGQNLCEEGAVCDRHPAVEGDTDRELEPFMCDPAAGLRAPGERCLDDADCQSGSCDDHLGSLRICDSTGRPCDSDDDCTLWGFEGTCQRIGVLDGTCR